ncbi:hypothetical protein HOD08_03875 [bacterium]|jgi:hypothetical protein|nr:hypothetical protein [bacterium]
MKAHRFAATFLFLSVLSGFAWAGSSSKLLIDKESALRARAQKACQLMVSGAMDSDEIADLGSFMRWFYKNTLSINMERSDGFIKYFAIACLEEQRKNPGQSWRWLLDVKDSSGGVSFGLDEEIVQCMRAAALNNTVPLRPNRPLETTNLPFDNDLEFLKSALEDAGKKKVPVFLDISSSEASNYEYLSGQLNDVDKVASSSRDLVFLQESNLEKFTALLYLISSQALSKIRGLVVKTRVALLSTSVLKGFVDNDIVLKTRRVGPKGACKETRYIFHPSCLRALKKDLGELRRRGQSPSAPSADQMPPPSR